MLKALKFSLYLSVSCVHHFWIWNFEDLNIDTSSNSESSIGIRTETEMDLLANHVLFLFISVMEV